MAQREPSEEVDDVVERSTNNDIEDDEDDDVLDDVECGDGKICVEIHDHGRM